MLAENSHSYLNLRNNSDGYVYFVSSFRDYTDYISFLTAEAFLHAFPMCEAYEYATESVY